MQDRKARMIIAVLTFPQPFGPQLSECEDDCQSFSKGAETMILPDNLPILRCLCCGEVMKRIRTVPSIGGLPGLVVLACLACNEVEVKEERRAA